ncbi:MAG TPA: GNAT family N-acetyltransferase [Desulfitobacterium dehalogenans]|uniref:GNAT family N-acetyltransferase n=1 Tax=Desulfitobacterium dehalogenans TaxID=36854 RepID=A0A7C7D7K9_9FIRM|nr:GNAT family N-acetyltransferase [Desulfitobacterium dehalogenans]
MSCEMVVENPNRTEQLISELASVWEASVKATHMFLNERDIIALRSFVETGIKEVDNLIVAYENQKPIGFMGIAQGKIEMLFLEPACIGKGIGKNLVTKAIQEHEVSYVDVNEQNPHAVDFYKRFGFVVYERTEFDEQGNSFPILKMKLR